MVEIQSNTDRFKQQHRDAIAEGVQNAARAFMEFTQKRFKAEGDGEWPELAESTQHERQSQGFPASHPILKRLGVLENALTEGSPGNVFEIDGTSCTVGIGGGDLHPGYDKNRKPEITIEDIARYHQSGKRKIFIPPDDQTVQDMQGMVTEKLTPLGMPASSAQTPLETSAV